MKLWPCALLLLVGCQMTSAGSDAKSSVLSSTEQQAMSPGQVLERLEAGNQRFQKSDRTAFDYVAQARASATGQSPMAYVLSCVDSRVLPETIFDCGIGDLFVGRVAGNFENTDQLGSMEFATAAVGTPLIVVLGHSSCGAVKGACDQVKLADNLTALLQNIAPAVQKSRVSGERSSKNPAFVAAVVENNVLGTIADIKKRSATIRERIAAGKLAIAGGIYDLETGAVKWISTPN